MGFGNHSMSSTLIFRTNNDTTCHFTTTFDPTLILLSIFLLIVASIGLFGNCILFALLRDAPLLHKNVRFSLVSLTLAAVIICSCFMIRGMFNLIMMTNNLSWPAITARKCSFIEMPATSAAFALCFSILIFGAERLYATWIRQTTENLSRWLVVMVVSLWSMAFFNVALVILTTEVNISLCYCHVLLCYKWSVIAATMVFYFITEILSLCLYFAVYHWNRIRLTSFGINSATHSLAERFQIANTIRATEILLPIVIVHGICGLTLQLASYYPKKIYARHGPTPHVIYSVLIITSSALIYSVLHPYLTIWKSDNLRKALKRLIARFIRRVGFLRRRYQIQNNAVSSIRLANASGIPQAVSSIDEGPTCSYVCSGDRVREMSLLSTGRSNSEGFSSITKEFSSNCAVTNDQGQQPQRRLSPEPDQDKKQKKNKSPVGVRATTKPFQMTPEQHCQLLEKYWE